LRGRENLVGCGGARRWRRGRERLGRDEVRVCDRAGVARDPLRSFLCGRRRFGACDRKSCSVGPVEAESAVNAIVRTLPIADLALSPPLSAKPAMNPTLPGFVVTLVKP